MCDRDISSTDQMVLKVSPRHSKYRNPEDVPIKCLVVSDYAMRTASCSSGSSSPAALAPKNIDRIREALRLIDTSYSGQKRAKSRM